MATVPECQKEIYGARLDLISQKQHKLEQVFTKPHGSHYTIGHKTEIFSLSKHSGGYYTINEKKEWSLDREYTLIKQDLSI